VLATPYSTLRDVELPADLPVANRFAIDNLAYGANTKVHVGFSRRFWGDYGSEGASYSDLPNHQTTWEPNPSKASPGNAVLLDYSGGARASSLNPARLDLEVSRWLTDLETIWGGAMVAAKKTAPTKFLAHMQHWSSDPFSKGAYTSNRPGYFTELEGRVGTPADNLFFCGEHTDSFYEWQGYMEGALNSGIRAAKELLA
jgi:monoamine oxidase